MCFQKMYNYFQQNIDIAPMLSYSHLYDLVTLSGYSLKIANTLETKRVNLSVSLFVKTMVIHKQNYILK